MPNTYTAALPAAKPSGSPTMSNPHQMPSIGDPSVQAADAWLRRFQAAVVSIMAAAAVGVGAVAFFTSFEAIKSYAKTSGGITPAHAWAVPLLVDSFIVIATGAELWLGVHPARRAWWELAWPRALLAGAAAVSFVLNVAHAKAGDWPARGVAAIPPAALVLSVELLVMIARRAAIARTHRLTAATQPSLGEATVVVRGDQATTMVAPTGDLPALEATSSTNRHTARANDHPDATSSAGDHQTDAAGDQPPTTPARAISGGQASGEATYQRVRDLYQGGMTVAAEIARELGISASYAQRTLRRVKADLARQQTTTTRDRVRTDPADNDPDDGTPNDAGDGRATTDNQRHEATRPDHHQLAVADRDHQPPTPDRDRQATTPGPNDQATSRPGATRDGDGRTTGNDDRHLVLVAPDRDREEVER